MRLSQRQIDLFNAIMIHKSMTAAAAVLGTSQPTISREIREMERRIGFDLFLRFGKRLTPTNQAVLLHETVRRSFIGLDEISRAASAIRSHNAANFRIASIPAHAESVIPRVIQRFLHARPAVLFSIHSHEEPSLRHEMTTQAFDLSLTESQFEREGATTETIHVGDMVCVLPLEHPLAGKTMLTPSDFEGQPFIYFGQNDPYRHKLDEIFSAAGVTRDYAAETTTAASVCAMVAAGVGVSVINPLTAASQAPRNVAFRRLSVSVPYLLSIWRPAHSTRTARADKFVATLREVVAEMSETLQLALEPQAPHGVQANRNS
ncbi:LysR family transcriptional regulator [Pseudodonghicola xiamenensis]|uniref:LysR family transcriptional regulator n=1 Tax=Pseudodonghicola xiamenensis TaxID=337702 RepID=A0A8J3H957_9RHOB|nr:LysR family transcriptional regulator [Pseudodonghicola xiamenensis]GHG96201.1 LysR family transcriptional regulator [Pseudodonghicola xiamenensis]